MERKRVGPYRRGALNAAFGVGVTGDGPAPLRPAHTVTQSEETSSRPTSPVPAAADCGFGERAAEHLPAAVNQGFPDRLKRGKELTPVPAVASCGFGERAAEHDPAGSSPAGAAICGRAARTIT